MKPIYLISLEHLCCRSLNRLEAFNLYGDTVLNSTVSNLIKKGFRFHKKLEPHTHRNGGIVHFTRYTLYDEDKQKARSLIKSWKKRNDVKYKGCSPPRSKEGERHSGNKQTRVSYDRLQS